MTHEQKNRLGIFLSLATVIFVAVAAFFLLPKLRDPGTVYLINFRDTSVHGLISGSLVKYRGVEVGRVTGITVNPADLDSIQVEVKIRPELTMKTDMRATLVYVGLTGQKFVELSGGTMTSPNLKAHGEILAGRGLGDKADDIVNNLETTASRIAEILSPENIARINAFLENVEKGSGAVAGVLQSRQGSLENTLISVEKATADFARATEQMVPMTQNLDRLIKTVEASSQKTLGNISDRFSAEEMGLAIKDVRDFLATASVSPTARRVRTITPWTPLASAVRIIAPRFCGSSTPSRTQ
jgi:phospholipid/cholesterol/gamma-HCH transport system substrate-binding protein